MPASGNHKQAVEGVRRLIAALGGACYVMHQGFGGGRKRVGLWGSAGIPDLHCFVPVENSILGPRVCGQGYLPEEAAAMVVGGQKQLAFWVEVKVGKDRLRPAQSVFKGLAEQAGGVVIVGTAADVVAFLGLEGKRDNSSATCNAAR